LVEGQTESEESTRLEVQVRKVKGGKKSPGAPLKGKGANKKKKKKAPTTTKKPSVTKPKKLPPTRPNLSRQV